MSKWDKNARPELRGACYRGDASVIVEAVRGRVTSEVLQLAGDGLLIALGRHAPEAAELAVECESALRSRDWAGDEDLPTNSPQPSAMARRPCFGR